MEYRDVCVDEWMSGVQGCVDEAHSRTLGDFLVSFLRWPCSGLHAGFKGQGPGPVVQHPATVYVDDYL